jgi:hypothetical protein
MLVFQGQVFAVFDFNIGAVWTDMAAKRDMDV